MSSRCCTALTRGKRRGGGGSCPPGGRVLLRPSVPGVLSAWPARPYRKPRSPDCCRAVNPDPRGTAWYGVVRPRAKAGPAGPGQVRPVRPLLAMLAAVKRRTPDTCVQQGRICVRGPRKRGTSHATPGVSLTLDMLAPRSGNRSTFPDFRNQNRPLHSGEKVKEVEVGGVGVGHRSGFVSCPESRECGSAPSRAPPCLFSAATRATAARSGVKCETVSTRFMFFRRNYITLKVGSRARQARPGFSSWRCRAVLPDPGQCVPVCVTVCLAPARLPAPSPLHRGFMAAWAWMWCLARPATGSAAVAPTQALLAVGLLAPSYRHFIASTPMFS